MAKERRHLPSRIADLRGLSPSLRALARTRPLRPSALLRDHRTRRAARHERSAALQACKTSRRDGARGFGGQRASARRRRRCRSRRHMVCRASGRTGSRRGARKRWSPTPISVVAAMRLRSSVLASVSRGAAARAHASARRRARRLDGHRTGRSGDADGRLASCVARRRRRRANRRAPLHVLGVGHARTAHAADGHRRLRGAAAVGSAACRGQADVTTSR